MTGAFFDSEEMEKRVTAKSQPDGFQRNNFIRGDVAEVYICAEQFDEPDLLGFLRSLPNDLLKWTFCQDLLYQA